MDFTKVRVRNLEVNDDIIWHGKPCSVVERLGPVTVKVREFKSKKVALREFKDRYHTISQDYLVSKITTRST